MISSAYLKLSSCVSAGILALLPIAAIAQRVPIRTYSRPIWTSSEAYSSITSVRELRDGRVLLSNHKDGEVWLLSTSGAPIKPVGRNGRGPGEFLFAGVLAPFEGDSTLLVDRRQRRMLVISPDGVTGRSILFPETVGASAAYAVPTDRAGELLFPAADWGTADDPTVPLVRWDVGSATLDTIARLTAPVPVQDVKGASTTRVVIPYTPEDGYTGGTDGAVVIVRAKPYRLERVSARGARQALPAQSYPSVRLTSREREAAVRQIGKANANLLPSAKPPFNATRILAAPAGETWIELSAPYGASYRIVDVLGPQGTRVAQVRLPARDRLMLVTERAIYVARLDEDDLATLVAFKRVP